MPRSSKKFILSNSQLNAQGFRMLTEGADLEDFRKNPVMLWMHNRAFKGTKDEVLPLGYWDDIKIEGDEVTAVPFFDDNDAFAMSIYHKVENGTLRTCSAGAVPIEMSDDPAHLLPGQIYATVTKWRMKEGSITDFGANPGALAVALYDQEENLITLSDKSLNTIIPEINLTQMKFIQLSAPEVAVKLGLGAEPTPEEVMAKIGELVTLSDTQRTTISGLETDKANLQTQLDTLKKDTATKEIVTLVDAAVADRKITAAQKEHFVKLAESNFDSVKSLLDAMPAVPTVQSAIAANQKTGEVELADKSWDELHKSGKLEFVKLNHPEIYTAKFKEKYGREPKN